MVVYKFSAAATATIAAVAAAAAAAAAGQRIDGLRCCTQCVVFWG